MEQPADLRPAGPRLDTPGNPTPVRHDCFACGSPLSRAWSTPDGTAWLCRECATLHGIGCP